MAEKETRAVQTDISEEEALHYVHENRRYVGKKETVAYILNDFSASFNIGKYQNRFIWDVVKIDFGIMGIANLFTGAWDVINDTFIGMLVDRTRTRWGKFRPYLIFFQIPLTVFGSLFWFMPFFFPDTAVDYMPKIAFYIAFNVIRETAGTFTSIAGSGFMSTITPHPVDRTRLITAAQFWSGWFGEKVPELLMGVFIDLINNNKVQWKLRDLFVGMGLLTSVIATAASFWFFLTSRERVLQTIERPNLRQGFKAIFNNYPIMLITLSDFLGGFSVSQSRSDYYIDVLGSATLQTVVGIPAGPVSTISYALIAPARRKLSTKAIWILEDMYTDMCWLSVLLVGSINGNFQKRSVMIPTFMIEEFMEMWVYGLRKVIPNELYNEAMDYCEWKNGYRMEAMTGVAKGLVGKLQGIVMNTVKNFILKGIGYEQGRKIGTQSYKTKWWLFAMGTGVPIITGSLGVVPKFFYPLTGARRDQMYAELLQRRQAVARQVSDADVEELERIGHEQMSGDYGSLHSLDK
ncbi:MAG: MFS transporter [Oscillospiraceae bacterium]|nr:MFS transporter [Oscillospiraceae bacterium]